MGIKPFPHMPIITESVMLGEVKPELRPWVKFALNGLRINADVEGLKAELVLGTCRLEACPSERLPHVFHAASILLACELAGDNVEASFLIRGKA